MYPIHHCLDSSFRYLLVLHDPHIFRLFLYDTKQEYGGPTKADEKYTSHEYFPSSANTFSRSVQEQNLLFLLSFAVRWLHQRAAAFSQTIVLIDMAQQLHRFFLSDRQSAYGLQF